MPVINDQTLQAGQSNANDSGNSAGNDQTVNSASDTIQSQVTNGAQQANMANTNNPNGVVVTVADQQTPIVVLFGPPACGKTMTLIRMTRFLLSMGYTINPIRTFRPANDTIYQDICNKFHLIVNSNFAAQATSRISFMLVEVLDHNQRSICQILEAPGEYYFDPQNPNAPFPNFVNAIIGSPNRKIWTIIVEPNWGNTPDRANYVKKISLLKQSMRAKDNTVFVYNKIDLTPYVRKIGDVNIKGAFTQVQNLYPSIFVPFQNQNPVTKLWREFNCDFVPFQTGFYTESLNGIMYNESPKEYCEILWSCIKKKITG